MFYYFLTLNSRHFVRKGSQAITFSNTYPSNRFVNRCDFQQYSQKNTPKVLKSYILLLKRLLEKVVLEKNLARISRWGGVPHGQGRQFSWGILQICKQWEGAPRTVPPLTETRQNFGRCACYIYLQLKCCWFKTQLFALSANHPSSFSCTNLTTF